MRNRKFLYGLIPVVAALFVAILSSRIEAKDQSPGVSAFVQLVPLKRGGLPKIIKAYGVVQPSDSARENISAPVASHVSKISVRVGESVKKGAPLIALAPTPETLAAYRQAELAVQLSDQLLATGQSLARTHLRTESELAKDQKAATEAKSQLDTLEKEGADGPTVIIAPQEAIVLKINVGIGSVVAPGAQLLELARPDGLMLDAGVIPAHANAISIGDKVSLATVGGGHSASGAVVMKSELVRQSDGLVPIQISLPQGKLKIGQFTEAQITTGQAEGFLVPHAAILVNDKGQTYVVQAVDMTARTVPVEVIGSDDENDVIQGNLKAGNDIVLAGNHQLEDGMHLRTADSKNTASNELAKK